MLTIILRMPPVFRRRKFPIFVLLALHSRGATKKPATHSGSWLGRNSLRLFGPRCSGDHPQSRLYFAASPPEEAAGKGEPIISNQIHLREFSQTALSI